MNNNLFSFPSCRKLKGAVLAAVSSPKWTAFYDGGGGGGGEDDAENRLLNSSSSNTAAAPSNGENGGGKLFVDYLADFFLLPYPNLI